MNGRKAISLLLGIGVSGVFLWMIFRSLPLDGFVEALERADPAWIAAALGCFLLGYACRIQRWRMMLTAFNDRLGWGRCATPFMVSIAANNVLPFRAGDVLRGVAFSRWLGVPTARVLATLLVERLLDLLSLIIALAVALSLFAAGRTGVEALFGWSAWFFALVACAVAFVLLLPRVFEPPVRFVIRLLTGRAPSLAGKLEAQVHHVFHTLASLAAPAKMAVMMLWSFLAWGFEASVFYSIARALPDITAPVAAWVAMPVGTLSTMLPSTPGYIGTFHYFVMQAAEALGNPEVAAAAFAFLVHLALFIPATLWGGAGFLYWMLTRGADSAPLPKATSAQ